MKYIKKILVASFILLAPVISIAQTTSTQLVPCDNTPTVNGNIVTYAHPCNFTALMTLINTVIHFILFDLALPIAAIMFAYAGVLLIGAGGEAASARTKAKGIFLNTLIGLVIAVAAYLIVKTVLVVMGYSGAGWIGF